MFKTRYYYSENGNNYEIDVFGEGLSGLVLVDLEFDSLEKKNAFVMPDWCLCDITEEKRNPGGILTRETCAEIEDELKAYGYVPLVVK